MMDIGVTPLAFHHAFPRSYAGRLTHWVGCRSQSLSLRPASRCRCHGLAAFSPWLPAGALHMRLRSDTADIRVRRPHQHFAC